MKFFFYKERCLLFLSQIKSTSSLTSPAALRVYWLLVGNNINSTYHIFFFWGLTERHGVTAKHSKEQDTWSSGESISFSSISSLIERFDVQTFCQLSSWLYLIKVNKMFKFFLLRHSIEKIANARYVIEKFFYYLLVTKFWFGRKQSFV